MRVRQYCTLPRDKASQCQQKQLPDVNFWPRRVWANSPWVSAMGPLMPPKSLQPWHHTLFKAEISGALTLAFVINQF